MTASYLSRLLAALVDLPAGVSIDLSCSLPVGALRPTTIVAKAVGRRAVFVTVTGSTYRGRHMGRMEQLPSDPAVFARSLIALAQDAPRADFRAPNGLRSNDRLSDEISRHARQ